MMDMGGAQKFIPAEAEPFFMELLERLGRLRALKDDESKLTEALVRRERRRAPKRAYHKWTTRDDRELLRVQSRPRGVADLAQRIGVSDQAAWNRLQRLRNLKRGAGKASRVEG
jgi:hypothetical protein